jgi:hypothetical protein
LARDSPQRTCLPALLRRSYAKAMQAGMRAQRNRRAIASLSLCEKHFVFIASLRLCEKQLYSLRAFFATLRETSSIFGALMTAHE